MQFKDGRSAYLRGIAINYKLNRRNREAPTFLAFDNCSPLGLLYATPIFPTSWIARNLAHAGTLNSSEIEPGSDLSSSKSRRSVRRSFSKRPLTLRCCSSFSNL